MQDSQLLDIKANKTQVHQLLGEIQISIDEMQAQAAAYNSFEKKFKVPYIFFLFFPTINLLNNI